MGRAISKIKHPFRDFNLESRAHKIISQPTPKLAPKHAKDEIQIKKIKEEFPEAFEESLKKNEALDQHLKNVFVVSHDAPIEKAPKPDPSRPLPQDKSQPGPFLFGHKEPDKVPLGKSTLRNALQFLSQHQNEPRKYTAAYIAKHHNLPEELVRKVLHYFRVFEIYIPQEGAKTKAKFAGPSRPKVQLIKEERKMLAAPEVKKDKDDT